MKVHELMNRRVLTTGPDTPMSEILELLLRFHLNNVVVANDQSELLGIVTYSDLCRRMLPSQQELIENEQYLINPGLMEDRFEDIVGLPVHEMMATDITTVSPDTHAIQAGALMSARRVKQLPVVAGNKLVGTVGGRLLESALYTREVRWADKSPVSMSFT